MFSYYEYSSLMASIHQHACLGSAYLLVYDFVSKHPRNACPSLNLRKKIFYLPQERYGFPLPDIFQQEGKRL